MSFNKKIWVNVPDPSNPPKPPEGQDSLAVFDADNMNRIEEGIDEAHKILDSMPDVLPINKGGTGATTAEQALRNLGIERAIITWEIVTSSTSNKISYPTGFNKYNTFVVSFMKMVNKSDQSDGKRRELARDDSDGVILKDDGIYSDSGVYAGRVYQLILERHDV